MINPIDYSTVLAMQMCNVNYQTARRTDSIVDIKQLPTATKGEVIDVYVVALRRVSQVAIAFICLGFFVFDDVEEHIGLRKQLNTESRLEKR